MVFKEVRLQDEDEQGLCQGLWEDKDVTDLAHMISQLCAGVMAEEIEIKFERSIRFPTEVCGVLTNGEKFIIFRRRTGNGQRVNHYFLCQTIEEIAIGIVHFLAVCQENLTILTDIAFNITAGVKKLSVNSKDTGEEEEEGNDNDVTKDQQGGPTQGASEPQSQLNPSCAKTSSSSQYGKKRISQKFLQEYFDNVPFPQLTAENLALMSTVR